MNTETECDELKSLWDCMVDDDTTYEPLQMVPDFQIIIQLVDLEKLLWGVKYYDKNPSKLDIDPNLIMNRIYNGDRGTQRRLTSLQIIVDARAPKLTPKELYRYVNRISRWCFRDWSTVGRYIVPDEKQVLRRTFY